MIDIHTHVIFDVDDGSKSIESSVEMLKFAKKIGTSDLICTPHYIKGAFETPKETIVENFNALKPYAEEIGINIYLGQEIAVDRVANDFIKSGSVLTLNNSRYALLEFPYDDFVDISNICYELKVSGFIPIIAHVERYSYVNIRDVETFISDGALIQINSSSVVESFFSIERRRVSSYLKNGLVHFVASDVHSFRKNTLSDAYEFIIYKYGQDFADKLFIENGKKVLQNEEIKF